MDIRQHLAYAENTRLLLQETLLANPEVFDRPFETIAAYKTIHDLVSHLIGAEERWVEMRLRNNPLPSRYESRAATSPEKIFVDWETIRSKTRVYIGNLDESGLQNTIAVDIPAANYTGVMTVGEILFHLFNHQSFHTGQISMALQHFGIDPPNFDYVFLR